jgi:hypothetical protein
MFEIGKEKPGEQGVVLHASVQETEAGALRVQGQPGLHSKNLSQKNKTKQNKK